MWSSAQYKKKLKRRDKICHYIKHSLEFQNKCRLQYYTRYDIEICFAKILDRPEKRNISLRIQNLTYVMSVAPLRGKCQRFLILSSTHWR